MILGVKRIAVEACGMGGGFVEGSGGCSFAVGVCCRPPTPVRGGVTVRLGPRIVVWGEVGSGTWAEGGEAGAGGVGGGSGFFGAGSRLSGTGKGD